LKAGVSNKSPNIIAHYYIESIRKYGVYPRLVRADMGTENVHVETIQKFLRRNRGDEHASEKSFLYGKSINNQRHVSSYESWIHSVFPDTFYVIVSNDIWTFIRHTSFQPNNLA
jgi:hypothetical protein